MTVGGPNAFFVFFLFLVVLLLLLPVLIFAAGMGVENSLISASRRSWDIEPSKLQDAIPASSRAFLMQAR